MTPVQILQKTRQLIAQHAGDDQAKWHGANRLVVAQLQLDERRTKVDIKRKLLDAGRPATFAASRFTPGEMLAFINWTS